MNRNAVGRIAWAASAGLVLAAGMAAAQGVEDDDLAIVKRGVAAKRIASAQEPPSPPAPLARPEPEAAPRRGGSPAWFRVRIVEKGGKKRVNVNLPLALVRAIGDDMPFEWGDWRGRHRHPTLSEILSALESGQQLVEVDDEDATVRIWVE